MAVSSAFAGAKLETLLAGASATSSPAVALSPSQIRVLCKPTRTKRALIHRTGPNIRCEVASDVLVQSDPNTDSRSSSSLSALEQLKTSAADRTSTFFSHIYNVCFHCDRELLTDKFD